MIKAYNNSFMHVGKNISREYNFVYLECTKFNIISEGTVNIFNYLIIKTLVQNCFVIRDIL